MAGSEHLLGIIMAGGRGTRLMPLTKNRPKPMVPVLGRPVIDYVKDAMVAAGLSEIIVTTGYQGEQLVSHVGSWNTKSRVNQENTPIPFQNTPLNSPIARTETPPMGLLNLSTTINLCTLSNRSKGITGKQSPKKISKVSLEL